MGLPADRDHPARAGRARGPRAARLPRGLGLALGARPAPRGGPLAARRGVSRRRGVPARAAASASRKGRCARSWPTRSRRRSARTTRSPSPRTARDPLAFLRAHARLLPQLTQGRKHAATHPPGPVLWYRGALALCERSPALTEALLAVAGVERRDSQSDAGARRPCRRAPRRARPGLARRADALAARVARRGARARASPGGPRRRALGAAAGAGARDAGSRRHGRAGGHGLHRAARARGARRFVATRRSASRPSLGSAAAWVSSPRTAPSRSSPSAPSP